MSTILDVFLSTFVAVTARSKAKQQKEQLEAVQRYRKEGHDFSYEVREIRRTYTNSETEREIDNIILKNGEKLFKNYVQMTDSYDNMNRFDYRVLGTYGYHAFVNGWILKRLLLGERGLIPRDDIGNTCFNITIESHDSQVMYENQVRYELLVKWNEILKENGFPYDLMVDDSGASATYPDIRYAIPVSVSRYNNNNKFFWNYKFNRHLEDIPKDERGDFEWNL